MELTNNTILITGGTSGIGRSLGNALLEKGNTVILLGRNKSILAQAEEEGFKTVICDLTNQEDVENAVMQIQHQYPEINMLFNNAGVQYNYDFKDGIIPIQKIADEINTNLTGQIVLTQMLIPLLSNAPKAWIVNTTSGLGAFPKDDGIVYSASKAAMRNFNKGLRYSLKSTSIKVLEFIPPVTATEMTASREETKLPVEDLIKQVLPQLERERTILTVPKMRLFLLIAFLVPSLAHKILSK